VAGGEILSENVGDHYPAGLDKLGMNVTSTLEKGSGFALGGYSSRERHGCPINTTKTGIRVSRSPSAARIFVRRVAGGGQGGR